MTMSREAKNDHKVQIDTAIYAPDKLTGTWFASPARRGEKMNTTEYRAHYMGRRTVNAETAMVRRMRKLGFVETDRGGWKRVTRAY